MIPMQNKTVADFLTNEISHSPLSQKEIAKICQFKTANIVTMLKQGLTKVPLDKVPSLAKALDVDEVEFFKMVMMEYRPDDYKTIIGVFGEPINAVQRKALEVIERHIPYSGLESESDYLKTLSDAMSSLFDDNQNKQA